jgi:outer membrane lipoprotein-sorting protein
VALVGTLTMWHDQGLVAAGYERRAAYSPTNRTASLGQPPSGQTAQLVSVTALWPDRWRLEWGAPTGRPQAFTVINGATWMTWSPGDGARSNFGDPSQAHSNPAAKLLGPAPIFGSELTGLVHAELGGRPGWHFMARPLERQPHNSAGWALDHVLDDYVVDVDQGSGLVVSLVGRLDGREAVRYYFKDLVLDAEVDDELFSLVPPDGSEVLSARGKPHPPRYVPLYRAAAEAGFEIFVPTAFPEGAGLEYGPLLADGAVRMGFGRPGFPNIFTLWQRRAFHPPIGNDSAWWQTRIVAGHEVEIQPDIPERAPSHRVRTVRAGTQLEIVGQLSTEELVHVLFSVVPAPDEQPTLPPG